MAACASVIRDSVVSQTGHVVTSTDPTGGPSTWTPALIDGDPCNETTPCSVEEIQASDGHGVQTVDRSHYSGSGPFLTGLTLKGDVLSWSHNGNPRSIGLTP